MKINDCFRQRREWLFSQVEPDSIIILVGNTEKTRNKNILYPFRQDNDFFYMTGYSEPDAIAVLRPESDAPFALFNQPSDEFQEVWFGARAGQSGAISDYEADIAFDIAQFERKLPELLENRQHVYLADETGRFHHRVMDWLSMQRRTKKFDEIKRYPDLHSVLPLIHQRRVIKDAHELSMIRHAVNASVEGHRHVMSICQPGMSEARLSGEFMGAVAAYDCIDVGYPNIVASGNNACCLHYDTCKDITRDGDMLLLDAGAEYRNYTADITRTFPVNGRFNAAQRDIYQLVLAAIDESVMSLAPDQPWNGIYERAMRVLASGLKDLGFLKGSMDEILETEAYKDFTLHKTGHWMGLDVHDVGPYHTTDGTWRKLQPGMVFTVEPGLYFPEHRDDIPAELKGMGVRIEDDLLITENGYENLSADAPRTIKEIEAQMNS